MIRVATTTHADLCVAFGDRATGARLYGELLPFARFQASSLNSRHYAKQATELMERLPDLPRQLSAREEEVAGLLARGLSNRAIAERLYLSERTVENHVSSALRKLGFSSRSEIAVWHALNRQPDISARDGRGSTGQE